MSEQETKIPRDHVVGVLPDDAKADDAVQALRRGGFDETLTMHRISSAGEDTNPLMSLIEQLAGHLSEDVAYIDQYKEEAEMGRVIVAAKVEDRDEADRAADLLRTAGAVNIRFFGRLAVQDMTPTTNPSAPSDERP